MRPRRAAVPPMRRPMKGRLRPVTLRATNIAIWRGRLSDCVRRSESRASTVVPKCPAVTSRTRRTVIRPGEEGSASARRRARRTSMSWLPSIGTAGAWTAGAADADSAAGRCGGHTRARKARTWAARTRTSAAVSTGPPPDGGCGTLPNSTLPSNCYRAKAVMTNQFSMSMVRG